jgi:hypothetical protein
MNLYFWRGSLYRLMNWKKIDRNPSSANLRNIIDIFLETMAQNKKKSQNRMFLGTEQQESCTLNAVGELIY